MINQKHFLDKVSELETKTVINSFYILDLLQYLKPFKNGINELKLSDKTKKIIIDNIISIEKQLKKQL